MLMLGCLPLSCVRSLYLSRPRAPGSTLHYMKKTDLITWMKYRPVEAKEGTLGCRMTMNIFMKVSQHRVNEWQSWESDEGAGWWVMSKGGCPDVLTSWMIFLYNIILFLGVKKTYRLHRWKDPKLKYFIIKVYSWLSRLSHHMDN